MIRLPVESVNRKGLNNIHSEGTRIVGVRLKQSGHAQKFLNKAQPLVKVDVTRREAKKEDVIELMCAAA
jgi:hypothetical protein